MEEENEAMKIDQIIDGVHFRASVEEWDIQALIAQRATLLASDSGMEYHAVAIHMDICAVHCNGNRLRLLDMLVAREHDFWTEILNIECSIDRATGKLGRGFVPHFLEVEEVPQ
jgi:hypothetical protein